MTVTVTKTKFGLPPEKLSGGNLRLPDGRRVDDVRLSELSRIFRDLNIEGINPEMGKQDCAIAYSKHLDKLRDAAGNSVVESWMEKHRPQLKMGRAE
jgi:hypothetical protein